MNKLIIEQPFKTVLRKKIIMVIGKLMSKLMECYNFYKSGPTHPDYSNQKPRLVEADYKEKDFYVNSNSELFQFYREEQDRAKNIENVSQYYLFKKIEQQNQKVNSIANIGCFYSKSDRRFIDKHPETTIYGLDFGRIAELNSNIAHPNLKFVSGYPLVTIENFKNIGVSSIDYALFTRTAVKLNPNELNSYMDALSKVAKNIMFLEVAKPYTVTDQKIDVEKIDVDNPVRLFNGLYLHNYPAVLKKYGYTVRDQKILPYDSFEQHFTPDHHFIYVHGEKT
ncbi:MAG: hypothetical protein V4736_07730 [Bdellovibrionota bacterium]